LPVVWPFESYGRFPSGGIGFGNVNVELVGSEHGQSGLAGVALEPASLSEVLGQLDTQGLEHGPPEPFSQTDSSGAERLLWTTIDIKTLPPADAIFFCKYNFDVDERRERIRRELKDHGGGPLGIEALAELVIGVKDLHAAQHEWSVLLGPVASGKEILWHAGSGPAIRMIAAKEDRLVLLRVEGEVA